MSTSRRALRIHLAENVDPTRAERDARSLRDDLRRLDEVDVAFADDLAPEPGAKGPSLSPEIVLVVLVGSTALRAVTAAIQAWVERSAKRKVRLSFDGAREVIEVQGGIGPDEARILQEWSKRMSQ
jgi:Effector Associated Constant Component 1